MLIRKNGACTVMIPVASVMPLDVAVMVPVPLTTGVKVVEIPVVGIKFPATALVPPHATLRAPIRSLYTS